MTIRDALDKKKRRVVLFTYAGLLAMVLGVYLWSFNRDFVWVAAFGFMVAWLVHMYAYLFGFRCPQCGGQWYALAMHSGGWSLALDDDIRFCPYCASDIDSEIDEGQGRS